MKNSFTFDDSIISAMLYHNHLTILQVWNIADLSLVYQSTIITASPFLSMTMNLHMPQVAIGTADGIVRVFDLSDGKDFRCIHQINIGKIMDKYRISKEQMLLTPKSSKNGIVIHLITQSFQIFPLNCGHF